MLVPLTSVNALFCQAHTPSCPWKDGPAANAAGVLQHTAPQQTTEQIKGPPAGYVWVRRQGSAGGSRGRAHGNKEEGGCGVIERSRGPSKSAGRLAVL